MIWFLVLLFGFDDTVTIVPQPYQDEGQCIMAGEQVKSEYPSNFSFHCVGVPK